MGVGPKDDQWVRRRTHDQVVPVHSQSHWLLTDKGPTRVAVSLLALLAMQSSVCNKVIAYHRPDQLEHTH